MNPHYSYDLAWNPYEPQRDQSERAHQRWLRAQAVRDRRTRPQLPQQPRR